MYRVMDSSFTKQQPDKYVMSLDSLDFSLLPSSYCYRLNDNNSFLWSLNNRNCHKDNYYQFEIKPKMEAATSEIENSNVTQETTTCYICNTEVPLAYIVDHEDSLKHKAYAKIADVVLNRARKHMLKRDTNKRVQKADSIYFCAPCVLVVHVKDKKSHEKLNSHKQSVSLDRLLHELVVLYTEEDIENTENDAEQTESIVDANANYVCSSEAEVNTDIESNTVVISDIKASLRKHENEIKREQVDERADTQMEYIKLIDQYDTEKLNTLTPENGNIRIETQDGFEVTVSEDNFHGFMRIGKRHVQCKICKVIIKDEYEHKTSEDHIRKIVKPFADKHCVRILDNSWSHCVICNAVIDNSDVHALCNQAHEKLLQKALGIDEDQTNQLDKKRSCMYNCSVCKISIHINDIDTHMNGYKHAMSLKAMQESDPNFVNPHDSKEPKPTNDVNEANIQTAKEITDNLEHYCPTCNIILHINSVDSHLNGNKHAMNSKSPLHYVMKLVDGAQELICRVCSVYVVDNPVQVKAHVETDDHQSKLKEFLEDNRVTEEGDRFYCKPCQVFIMKMNEFYHIEKLSHEVNLNTFKEKKEKENVYEDFHLCHICEVLIPNNPDSIAVHNDGDRHKTNIAQVGMELAELSKADAVPKPQTTAKLYHEMIDTVNPKEVKCKICEVIVPNKEDAIDMHVRGVKHRLNLRSLMDENLIELKNDKYYCNPCKVVVAAERELMHIERPKHMKKLAKYKSNNNQTSVEQADAVESKGNETPKSNTAANAFQTNNTSATVAKVVKNDTIDLYPLVKHYFKDIGIMGLECIVCKVSMIPNSPTDALIHATSIEHKTAYNKIMNEHLMFEGEGGEFYCGICNCLVPAKGELIHLYSPKHNLKRVQVTQNAEFCAECNAMTAGIDMKEHITTSQHMTSVKRKQTFLYYCEDCGALVKKKSEDKTVLSPVDEHKEKCHLLRLHRLVVKYKYCFCVLCDFYFSKELIEEHVISNNHMSIFSKDENRV